MMKDNEWKEAIHILRRQAGFDFAGIASVVRTNRTLLVWRAASGNRNRNYLKIVLEPGKGIAGGVFQHKKTMIVQDVKACYTESEIVHSPILLAEDLGSFTAFPLWKDEEVKGVLLFGMRCGNCLTRERYKQLVDLLPDRLCGMKLCPGLYDDALENSAPFKEYRELPIYELVDLPVRAALREERHRIARDLHDSVIQNLLGVQMFLRTLKYVESMDEIREGLLTADDSLSQIQKELRDILVSVKPDIVEKLGLLEAFRKHIRFLEESYQIHVDFRQNIGDRRFMPDIETVYYRVGQEAMANACKYAGVSVVRAELFLEEEHILVLEICDNGKGFDSENMQISGGGMGLPGMYYWAASIGAVLTVRSAPGLGTSVRMETEAFLPDGDQSGLDAIPEN